jgi:trans-aconitate methyltransferase
LTEDEVLYRIARKGSDNNGARGWFDEEWDWHDPQSVTEIGWFYKSSQSYLFSSARHPYWKMLDKIPEGMRVIYDFGGGVGTNTVELYKRGYIVQYYEPSIIQRDFVKYRTKKYCDIDILDGITDCMCVDVLILQDVLEHIPQYSKTLNELCCCLHDGSYILERSPFRPQGHRPNRKLKMHLEADVPLHKAMKKNGMKLMETYEHNTHLWMKI